MHSRVDDLMKCMVHTSYKATPKTKDGMLMWVLAARRTANTGMVLGGVQDLAVPARKRRHNASQNARIPDPVSCAHFDK